MAIDLQADFVLSLGFPLDILRILSEQLHAQLDGILDGALGLEGQLLDGSAQVLLRAADLLKELPQGRVLGQVDVSRDR